VPWGAEIGSDETPFEAGMMFAVKLDKPAGFIGRAALLAAQGKPLRKKLVTLVPDTADAYAWGGESIVVNGDTVGEVSSVGCSPKAGACVALGYVRGTAANQVHDGTPAQIVLWGDPMPVRLFDRWPVSDPTLRNLNCSDFMAHSKPAFDRSDHRICGNAVAVM
jgi:glycine cleavage system aminomethyltransferase T